MKNSFLVFVSFFALISYQTVFADPGPISKRGAVEVARERLTPEKRTELLERLKSDPTAIGNYVDNLNQYGENDRKEITRIFKETMESYSKQNEDNKRSRSQAEIDFNNKFSPVYEKIKDRGSEVASKELVEFVAMTKTHDANVTGTAPESKSAVAESLRDMGSSAPKPTNAVSATAYRAEKKEEGVPSAERVNKVNNALQGLLNSAIGKLTTPDGKPLRGLEVFKESIANKQKEIEAAEKNGTLKELPLKEIQDHALEMRSFIVAGGEQHQEQIGHIIDLSARLTYSHQFTKEERIAQLQAEKAYAEGFRHLLDNA